MSTPTTPAASAGADVTYPEDFKRGFRFGTVMHLVSAAGVGLKMFAFPEPDGQQEMFDAVLGLMWPLFAAGMLALPLIWCVFTRRGRFASGLCASLGVVLLVFGGCWVVYTGLN